LPFHGDTFRIANPKPERNLPLERVLIPRAVSVHGEESRTTCLREARHGSLWGELFSRRI
ncbi:hypothetical protein N9I65_03715, partial [bacterium]|nr:hypothetical protein [bacterium]